METEYCLVDIPSTLTPDSFRSLQPISAGAPTQPRNPAESKKEGVKWPQADDLEKIHELYGKAVESALDRARQSGVRQWCKERIEREDDAIDNDADFRKWNETFEIMKTFENDETGGIVHHLSENNGNHICCSLDLANPSEENRFGLEELYGRRCISNTQDEMRQISIFMEPVQTFYIPARSSFILDTFPSASATLTAYTLNTSPFDLIILDPPWHNKAVSRMKRKRGLAYSTRRNMASQLPVVGKWLGPRGIVGIWSTNNLKTINQIKTDVFKKWQVELIAEWVWLKVSAIRDASANSRSRHRESLSLI